MIDQPRISLRAEFARGRDRPLITRKRPWLPAHLHFGGLPGRCRICGGEIPNGVMAMHVRDGTSALCHGCETVPRHQGSLGMFWIDGGRKGAFALWSHYRAAVAALYHLEREIKRHGRR